MYATAVSNYFQGNHTKSIENMKQLINKHPSNPFYNELLGEIYFANNDYKSATFYHEAAINNIDKVNDLYYMMMGNYLLTFEEINKSKKWGYKFQYDLGGFGGYQAIMLKDGVYYGACDSRKDGHASG